jgi:2-iminobutanoate/2-iminopropanoate deaminase
MKVIHTNNAPKAVGPYSQAIVGGDIVFCSGQIGIDPVTNMLTPTIEGQTKQALKNLAQVLQEAGTSLQNVVKTTMYLKNMGDYTQVNDIYASFFEDQKPARSTIEVARLPKDALIEIEAIATFDNK